MDEDGFWELIEAVPGADRDGGGRIGRLHPWLVELL